MPARINRQHPDDNYRNLDDLARLRRLPSKPVVPAAELALVENEDGPRNPTKSKRDGDLEVRCTSGI
jgi:hypothetical protein